MKFTLDFTAEAIEDTSETCGFLIKKSPQLGMKFQNYLDETFRQIAEIPELRSIHPFRHPEMQDIRICPVKKFSNYLIFYRIADEHIEIVRLLHGATDYMTIFEIDDL